MTKFREGDIVSIKGEILSDFVHEGRINVRVEPYHDIYVNIADLTMVKPVIEAGDLVWMPDDDPELSGTVLAVAEDRLWVSLGAGKYETWSVRRVLRLDAETAADDERDAA